MNEKLSEAIGKGVQLFRIRKPMRHFEELADLGSMSDVMIAGRKVWRLKGSKIHFALLSIPYKDVEDILVRADSPDWSEWNWKALAEIADGCRWRGPKMDTRWIN